jgi:hypothetical protein
MSRRLWVVTWRSPTKAETRVRYYRVAFYALRFADRLEDHGMTEVEVFTSYATWTPVRRPVRAR